MPGDEINGLMLEELRAEVRVRLTSGRFAHTEGVEATAAAVSAIYAPELIREMRAAALLHDITKEYSSEKQLKICRDFGIMLRDDEIGAREAIHAITAAAIIPHEFPLFASPVIIGAVRWHATGRAEMTLPEKIIWLSDYIEEGRKYPDCARVRNYFWSGRPEGLRGGERADLLDRALIMALKGVISRVISRGGVLNRDTAEALRSLAEQPE